MQQTIEFTFDPTKADRQERSRLEKLRWLPPLADDLKMKMPEPIRVSYGTTRKKIKENIKSNSIGKFPKIVMKESDKLKQTLKMNPNARYLTRLHNESLKDAAQKRLDQQQRDLVAIQAYDWNLVKKVSHELPFYRYVEKLQRNGQQLILEDEKEAQETLFSITMERSGSIPHDNDEFGLNATTPESTNTLQETQQDFLETLKIYMETSPFRLKQKEILEATPFELYQDYCFGKPEPLRDENEFQRTFADLDTLGHTLANCSKVVNAETEKHTIPPTIVLEINIASSD
jgi:hypothetical protein